MEATSDIDLDFIFVCVLSQIIKKKYKGSFILVLLYIWLCRVWYLVGLAVTEREVLLAPHKKCC